MVGDRDREVDEAGHGGDAAPTRPLVQGGTAVMTEGDNRICRLPRACRRAALFLSAQRKNGPSTSSGRTALGEHRIYARSRRLSAERAGYSNVHCHFLGGADLRMVRFLHLD